MEVLGELGPEAAATLVAAASDVTLVLDADGVVLDVAVQADDLARDLAGAPDWIGRRWADLVTPESRPKLDALLRDLAAGAQRRWRQVNHPAARGPDVPVLYSVARVGEGRVIAFGREMRAVSALQQRVVEAQQGLERDYARLRQAETRYRLLFQTSSEAVLVLDGAGQKIVEANPAAQALLGATPAAGAAPAKGGASSRGRTRSFLDAFDAASAPVLGEVLAAARASGGPAEARARLAAGREVRVAACALRQDGAPSFLVRVAAPQDGVAPPPRPASKLLSMVENAPDGFVVVGGDERVIAANAAFLDMAGLGSEERARGQPLDRWLGRSDAEYGALMANLRRHGSVRLFATAVRGAHGELAPAEVSAVRVPNDDQPCFGFAVRAVGRRLAQDADAARRLPRSVEQLTELIGHVPLKELVREATDVIEKLCIEAALELTGDNRASAAEMLGLSRQSLYVKLRRYGLGDSGPGDPAADEAE